MAEGGGIGPIEGLATESGASSPFSPAPPPPPPDEPSICQFLASRARDGTLGPAVPAVDATNHCIAVGEPAPQFPQQQNLVCLAAAHVNCPRYLRGMVFAGAPSPAPVRDPVSPAVIGAALVLLASIAASFGFLAIRGGFDLAVSTAEPGQLAVAATPSIAPSVAIATTPAPTSTPSPSLPPSQTPSPTPSSTPPLTPEPTPVRTPSPTPTPRPTPTSNRFAVLTRCPSTPDCWIYTIRSGDNLRSIANYFGVSYDKVLAMNPNLRRPIHAGDKLRIPTPTR